MLPPLPEQEKITEILTTCDKVIGLKEKLIAEKEKQKTWLLENLLIGKKRLNGFSGDWEKLKLGKTCEMLKGSGLSKSNLIKNGKYECVLYGEIFTTYDIYIKSVVSKTNIIKGLPSVQGDVMLPGSTTTCCVDLAKAVVIGKNGVLLGGDIIVLRNAYKSYNSHFMAYVLTYKYRKEIGKISQGITIKHLHGSKLTNLIIELPTIEEQTVIANVLFSADSEIELMNQELIEWKQKRTALMQLLLTGKVRVKV